MAVRDLPHHGRSPPRRDPARHLRRERQGLGAPAGEELPPGLDTIRKVGVSKVAGIAPAALMMNVATPDQLAWLKANEKVEIPAPVEPAVRLAVLAGAPFAILGRAS
ncbi:hypothetical protein IPV08_08275 [Methylobacterium sp. SD274]|nr:MULTISPECIES: hypothetical protein [Methylobacterium]MBO1019959.1 hypothetical protein [Methylobacterium sp. SD274]